MELDDMKSPRYIGSVIITLCVVFILMPFTSAAQEQRDSKGKEFWCSFLPNIHNSQDSLYLHITADSAVNGTVEYISSSGERYRRTFVMSDPRRAVIIGLSPQHVELRGSVQDSLFSSNSQSGKILSTQVVHVSADKDISLSVLNKGNLSSDAFLALPTDMLGRSYLLLAAKNSRMLKDTLLDANRSTPSQCCIVATADSTIIKLQLSADGVNSPRSQSLLLHKGQCYFVQAQISTDSIAADLSGSRISASKPVAVFAGQQQTAISSTATTTGLSRNHLSEQLLPLELWDSSYVLAPFPDVASTTPGSDVIRVIASADNTVLRINGQVQDTLAFAEVFEAPLTQASVVESSEPIMVMQYKKSSAMANEANAVSDASMMTVVPSRQFLSRYRFVSMQAREGIKKAFNDQYMMMVVPDDAIKSIQFDGAAISTQFTSVAGSGYSVGMRKIADGIHSISCDKAFGLYVCGYGVSDMYSYPAGMGAHPYPYLQAKVSINDGEAKIGDSLSFVVRLEGLRYPPPVLEFTPSSYSFVVRFNATILTPTDPANRGTIKDGFQYAHFSGKTSALTVGDTLIHLPLICGLGDAEYSSVELAAMTWIDASGDTIPSMLEQRSGTFHLRDVWRDTMGTRLVNPQGAELQLLLTPNPMTDYCNLTSSQLQYGQGLVLKMYDAMANELRDYSTIAIDRFTKGLPVFVERKDLPAGVYYLRLSYGTHSIVRQLIIL